MLQVDFIIDKIIRHLHWNFEMICKIGCGSGGAPDLIAPAKDLAAKADIGYLCFEALAERTLSQGVRDRHLGLSPGFDEKLDARFRAVLPACLRRGIKVITNMGGANPLGAGEATIAIARDLGLSVKVAVIEGDDVTALIGPDAILHELNCSVQDFGRSMLSANAYIGAGRILEALENGADVIIGGRISDAALFLGPIMYEYDIAVDDWSGLAAGTLVGHLMECSTQITGGYFADPGFKDVEGLDNLGFPIAEVHPDGNVIITKLPETGGCVTQLTVKEQLLYEIHDPTSYRTPDVIADFSHVAIKDLGNDRVQVSGAKGAARPNQLKVQVGFDGGLLVEGEISYAGPGARARAELAGEIVRAKIVTRDGFDGPIRFDLIGVHSLHATAGLSDFDQGDVRLRVAMRTDERAWADRLLDEVQGLWLGGPAGGGGFRGCITPSVLTQPTFIDRDKVTTSVRYLET